MMDTLAPPQVRDPRLLDAAPYRAEVAAAVARFLSARIGAEFEVQSAEDGYTVLRKAGDARAHVAVHVPLWHGVVAVRGVLRMRARARRCSYQPEGRAAGGTVQVAHWGDAKEGRACLALWGSDALRAHEAAQEEKWQTRHNEPRPVPAGTDGEVWMPGDPPPVRPRSLRSSRPKSPRAPRKAPTPVRPTSTNEVGRFVVQLPESATIFGDRLVVVARQRGPSGEERLVILGHEDGKSAPYTSASDLVATLCRGRAIDTVDGDLVVDGRAVTPEAYLGLWRAAAAAPLTLEEVEARYGLACIVTLQGPLAANRGKRRCWSSAPWETFDGFEADYRDRWEAPSDESRFRLILPLAGENVARDTYHAWSMIRDYRDPEVAPFRIEFRPVGETRTLDPLAPIQPGPSARAIQPDLFFPDRVAA